MNRLALGVAARTLFGAGLTAAEYQDVAEAVSGFVQWYHQSTHPLGPLLQLLPTRATRGFKAGKRRLSAVITSLVDERRRKPGDDILSRLLGPRYRARRRGDVAEDLHDEAVTLLIAGHETTGATLAWAWHMMALHPEVGDRLAAEVHAAVGDAPRVARIWRSWRMPGGSSPRHCGCTPPRLRCRVKRRSPSKWAATRCRKARWSWSRRGAHIAIRGGGSASRIPARALEPGSDVRPAKVRVPPFWRWRTHLYRRGVRVERGRAGAGHPGPTLACDGSAWAGGATRGAVHCSSRGGLPMVVEAR